MVTGTAAATTRNPLVVTGVLMSVSTVLGPLGRSARRLSVPWLSVASPVASDGMSRTVPQVSTTKAIARPRA